MNVGETYEVHWPHSALGACGTPNQYQTPFYDGVFCGLTNQDLSGGKTAGAVGVHAQIFTIVNDENYYYPDMIRGMIVDGTYGKNITYYTGSTTGTSRSNTICSKYSPITWQVDRQCHLISASSFDKMCADMKLQRDDMSGDLYPHGSRELVADSLAANNHQNRLLAAKKIGGEEAAAEEKIMKQMTVIAEKINTALFAAMGLYELPSMHIGKQEVCDSFKDPASLFEKSRRHSQKNEWDMFLKPRQKKAVHKQLGHEKRRLASAPSEKKGDGASFILGAITNSNGLNLEAHQGTLDWASSNHITVIKEVTLSNNGSTPLTADDKAKVQEVIAHEPDVVTIAGSKGDIAQIIFMLRNPSIPKEMQPKAIVAPDAWSNTAPYFAHGWGHLALRGVIMPVQFSETLPGVDVLARIDAKTMNRISAGFWPDSGKTENICAGAKIPLANLACAQADEQAGTDVSEGYKGEFVATAPKGPITEMYPNTALCPVNVHWHLGAEHRSEGQFDEDGVGPGASVGHRRLASNARLGFRCHHYTKADSKFTREYTWRHCVGMQVGETYEVHWPHSSLGACGTINQYQTPFYDGVFCMWEKLGKPALTAEVKAGNVGVQSQVFTIVNDESYYFPNLMRGMIVDGDYGKHITAYTGSTTGTSRSNTICSAYSPITWQVDRTCHLISASTFDKMCADMKQQNDDMSTDLYAHGARQLVADRYAANNHGDLRRLAGKAPSQGVSKSVFEKELPPGPTGGVGQGVWSGLTAVAVAMMTGTPSEQKHTLTKYMKSPEFVMEDFSGEVKFHSDGTSYKNMHPLQYTTFSKQQVLEKVTYPMIDMEPCSCIFQGGRLPQEAYHYFPMTAGKAFPGMYKDLHLVSLYGTSCAAWDSMPETPWAEWCPPGADFSHQDYNWCRQPWCYVDPHCPDAIPDTVFAGMGLAYSYTSCGAPADCFTGIAYQDDFQWPVGCPYDPSGQNTFGTHMGHGCECIHAGKTLPESLLKDYPDDHKGKYNDKHEYPFAPWYGTSCAAWDQMPGTPYYENCPMFSDWCLPEFTYCQAPWCYVGTKCESKIRSKIFTGSYDTYFSYDTCLSTPDCYTNLIMDEPLPHGCPFDWTVNGWSTQLPCFGNFTQPLKECVDLEADVMFPQKGTFSVEVNGTLIEGNGTVDRGNFTPAAGKFCPIVTKTVVAVSMTINGVTMDALAANPAVKRGLESAMGGSFAAAAGVAKENVKVTLSAGSIKVLGEITVPEGQTPDSLSAAVGGSNLQESALSSVSAVEGINSVATGTIGVTAPAVAVVTVEQAVEKPYVHQCSVTPIALVQPEANDEAGTAAFLEASANFSACLVEHCEDYVVAHHKSSRRLAPSPSPEAEVSVVTAELPFCQKHACDHLLDTVTPSGDGHRRMAGAPVVEEEKDPASDFGKVKGLHVRDLCPKTCMICASDNATQATPVPTPGDPTPAPTAEPTIADGGQPVIITLQMKLTGVTFNELKDNPSIRTNFVAAVKAGVLESCNLNNTGEIELMMTSGSIIIGATITPPAGSEHAYNRSVQAGIANVALLVQGKVEAVPSIDSIGTGQIAVEITRMPEMTQNPPSSFNAAYGEEADEREYANLGLGQCRLKNENMAIPTNVLYTGEFIADQCRQLCNERLTCYGFTSNSVFKVTVDEATGTRTHEGEDGTGPCILYMQKELEADGFDDYDGSCYIKKARCVDDLMCPTAPCGQCKASEDGEKVPTDADDVTRRACLAETCDRDVDTEICCNAVTASEDDTDGAERSAAPVLLAIVALGHLF
jgi:hypothetical protein